MFVFGMIIGVVILALGVLGGYRLGAGRWPWEGVGEDLS